MSEDVIEVDFDDDRRQVTKEQEAPAQQQAQKMPICVLGNTELGRTMVSMYTNPKTEVFMVDTVDEMVDRPVAVTLVCLDVKLNPNDTPDDVEILDACLKLSKLTKCGISLKTAVAPETIKKIVDSIPEDVQKSRFCYHLDFTIGKDFDTISESSVHIISCSEDVFGQHVQWCRNFSNYMFDDIIRTSPVEASVMQYALLGFAAVKQQYYNQLLDYVQDFDVPFGQIRESVEKISKNRVLSMPTYLRAMNQNPELSTKQAKAFRGEYNLPELKAFVGSTEKLSLIDEAIRLKNLRNAG